MSTKILDTVTFELSIEEMTVIVEGLKMLCTKEALAIVNLMISEVERQKLSGQPS